MCPLRTPPGAKPPTRCDPKALSRSRRTAAARAVRPARSSRSRSSSSAPPCWQVRACCRRPVRAAATTRASSSERSRASATAAALAFADRPRRTDLAETEAACSASSDVQLHRALARAHRAVDHAGHPPVSPDEDDERQHQDEGHHDTSHDGDDPGQRTRTGRFRRWLLHRPSVSDPPQRQSCAQVAPCAAGPSTRLPHTAGDRRMAPPREVGPFTEDEGSDARAVAHVAPGDGGGDDHQHCCGDDGD